MQEKRIVKSVADSLLRLKGTEHEVASTVDSAPVATHVNRLSRPGSPSSTLKKAGVALIVATPDPVTAIPGVALVAISCAVKSRDPTKLDDLSAEARKILRDIQSLRL